MSCEYIDIPLDSGSGGVRFFPDELPVDHIDLIDVLRSEIPPLKIWKRCAVGENCCPQFSKLTVLSDRIL